MHFWAYFLTGVVARLIWGEIKRQYRDWPKR
jgi:hypothetical protein